MTWQGQGGLPVEAAEVSRTHQAEDAKGALSSRNYCGAQGRQGPGQGGLSLAKTAGLGQGQCSPQLIQLPAASAPQAAPLATGPFTASPSAHCQQALISSGNSSSSSPSPTS